MHDRIVVNIISAGQVLCPSSEQNGAKIARKETWGPKIRLDKELRSTYSKFYAYAMIMGAAL